MFKQTPIILVTFGLLAGCETLPEVDRLSYGDAIVVIGDSPETTKVDGKYLERIEQYTNIDNGVLKGWRISDTTPEKVFGYFGTSSSGDLKVFTASTSHTSNYPQFDRFDAAAFVRTDENELPSEGTATYTGDYVGHMSIVNTSLGGFNYVKYFVHGDVSLTADFAESEISGDITNRRTIVITGHALSRTPGDVHLGTAKLKNNGQYKGSTSGGLITNYGDAISISGSYIGVIAGENGQETAGAVDLTHVYSLVPTRQNELWKETGVFLAE